MDKWIRESKEKRKRQKDGLDALLEYKNAKKKNLKKKLSKWNLDLMDCRRRRPP